MFMIKRVCVILTIIVAGLGVIGSGCGQPDVPVNDSNSRPASNRAATENSPSNVNQAPSADANATTPVGNFRPPNAANTRQEGSPPASDRRVEIPGKDGPAPDDSVITSGLGENFVQTRTFRSHPQLSKVERTTLIVDGKPRYSIKVYLKNGQVKEVAAEKLRDPLTERAAPIF